MGGVGCKNDSMLMGTLASLNECIKIMMPMEIDPSNNVHSTCVHCLQQGKALNEVADRNCKVLVVGNPCNTNALIAMENAPNIPRKNFHALTRLDENRAKCQLALKAGKFYTNVSRVAIWGNHSTTQVPDYVNARIGGRPAIDVIQDMKWFKEDFTPTVAGRGGALIKKWGRSSAASTAVSTADAIRSLVVPTAPGDCFSTAVITDGNPYGIKEGLIFSMPCRLVQPTGSAFC